MEITQVREKAKKIKEETGLNSYPVGVKFIFDDQQAIPGFTTRLLGYRYCQAVMKARHGEHVTLDKEGITCAAGTAAFGFKPLSEALKNGKGLVGFGITKEENTGIRMFAGMTTLKPGELKKLYLFPLETAVVEPDIVVIEDDVEKLMWISLAYLNVKGGQRVESSTAILQAVCVDATLIPYKEQKMNLSYGCYGCRDANDIETGETAIGFPFKDFEKISEYIDYLAKKAISNSRNKGAYAQLRKKEAELIAG
jgi:uncharacterized protein (DUF169 family)